MPPKVFISSTVTDLADVRSAAKYWLEENGFEVLTSETSTFPYAAGDAATASLPPLDECDFYLLFIGTRRGSLMPAGDISVTRAEFRRARAQYRRNGHPRLVQFVRQGVWTLRHATQGPRDTDDWDAVKAFLAEVTTSDNPDIDETWVTQFTTFRDIVDRLRATMRISGPLRRHQLAVNVVSEIEQNAVELVRKRAGKLHVCWQTAPTVVPNGVGVQADRDEMRRLTLFRLSWPRPGGLQHVSLDAAIESGEFLDFDTAASQPVVGAQQRQLLRLRQEVQNWERLQVTFAQSNSVVAELLTIMGPNRPNTALLSRSLIEWLYAMRACLRNLGLLHAAVHASLTGGEPDIPPLEALAHDPDEQVRIEAEQPTIDERREWLASLLGHE